MWVHRRLPPSFLSTLMLAAVLGAACSESTSVVDKTDSGTDLDGDGGNPPSNGGSDAGDSGQAVDAGDAGTDSGPDSCGDQDVVAPETCDVGIASGSPGACPTSCDDSIACTTDTLVNPGTCNAVCAHADIVAATNGDGCCPNGATSLTDSDCPASCGNGNVDANEECDDANSDRWDGCYGCRFEQVLRITSLSLLNSDPAVCAGLPHKSGTSFNVLGPALDHPVTIPNQGTVSAISLANTATANAIANGSLITLTHPLDLDATLAARLGQDDASIRLALFAGGVPTGQSFDASAGAPFSIVQSATQLTGAALDPAPGQVLAPGSIVGSALSVGAGTSDISITLDLGNGPTTLVLHDALATATLANDGTRISGATNGVLCGSISAAELDRQEITNTTVTNFCGARSMLDMLARGCTAYSVVPVVSATQPNVDVGGDGFPSMNDFQGPVGNNQVVNVCYDTSSNTRIPAAGTDTNCPQDPAIDDAYGVALSFEAVQVRFAGTRTGP